ncbi:MAG: transporter substrate-binding domain-containing protein [Rhizobiaceae bacterium]
MTEPSLRTHLGRFCRTWLLAIAAALIVVSGVAAQQNPMIPNFWDPRERFIKPNVKEMPRLRFLTTTDFPPFSFIDKDKRLTGFHIDLARAICAELEVLPVCQIQALPFAELEQELLNGNAEAIIAGMAANRGTREKFAFSRPYFWLPARFVAQRSAEFTEPLSESLSGQEVGVVDGTSHAAMALAKFDNMRIRLFSTRDDALAALRSKQISAVFGDGLSLSFWLQSGRLEARCCHFIGGPVLSVDYFGNGMAIAISKQNRELQHALNYALRTVNDRGKFAELYLRYFPIGLF